MPRLVWITDIHLDFCDAARVERFLKSVAQQRPDGVLLGGDISESDRVEHWLCEMDSAWGVPIHFVLGNHDYYGSSIDSVRSRVAQLTRQRPRLNYLAVDGPIDLGDGWALVGHDGWADGRVGDYPRSVVMMNDYTHIRDFVGLDKMARWSELQRRGDEAAEGIQQQLRQAGQQHEQLLMLIHVPPFRDACWYEGQTSDDQWAPHFVCQAVGEATREYMRGNPSRQLTILCGHTHSPGICQPLPRVTVYTGGAEYGAPRVREVLELDATGLRMQRPGVVNE